MRLIDLTKEIFPMLKLVISIISLDCFTGLKYWYEQKYIKKVFRRSIKPISISFIWYEILQKQIFETIWYIASSISLAEYCLSIVSYIVST
jgi:hypothetical protein